MTTYAPKRGDRVHLTVEATVTDGGHYRVDHTTIHATDSGKPLAVDSSHWVWSSMSCIVKVEPAPRAFPTDAGSIILARITGGTHPHLLILDVDDDDHLGWLITSAKSFGAIPERTILPGWVQIDPETLCPTGYQP